MARGIHRLNPIQVRNAKVGMWGDGGGLWLRVTAGKDELTRSWVFRFKGRHMGLGSVMTIGLKEAREKALEARRLLLDGIDPIEHRARQRALQDSQRASFRAFRTVAENYLKQF
ncbi:MAG TPA: Arm DNA-binding domain-containing protein, partial [Terriglobales bacterium]|nr:Arm DNA-binding domain-containing protein [Terriglobales bacterium]